MVEKVMSSLKTPQDELSKEVSQKNGVRIKRGLSEDVSVAPLFEAACNVKSPMKPINKMLFPSNTRENPTKFPPAVQIIGYQIVKLPVPVLACATVSQLCKLNTWHHNFFPGGTSSMQHISCVANSDE